MLTQPQFLFETDSWISASANNQGFSLSRPLSWAHEIGKDPLVVAVRCISIAL